jgi:hypothetical protein
MEKEEEIVLIAEEIKKIANRLNELGFITIAFRLSGEAEELKEKK